MGAREGFGRMAIVMVATVLAGCASAATSDGRSPTVRSTTTTMVSTAAGACVEPRAIGVTAVEIDQGGQSYPAEVYRPEAAETDRLPAVIDLHGLDADGPAQATMTGFRSLADREGFVVAEPSGPVGPLGVTGWELAALDEADRDDVAAIGTLVDDLVEDWCVDPHRVFVAGYSNGGFLAAELGCSSRVDIAGVAAVAGFHAPEPCEHPVPTLVVHGTADPIVPLGPGGTSVIVDLTTPDSVKDLLSSSIVDEVATSAADAGCEPKPTSSQLRDAIASTYRGCDGGAVHQLVLVEGGGHTWPGAAVTADADFLGPTTSELDATESIWEFFATHGGQG